MRRFGCDRPIHARATLSFDPVHLVTVLTLDVLLHGADGVIRHHAYAMAQVEPKAGVVGIASAMRRAGSRLSRTVGHRIAMPDPRQLVAASCGMGFKVAFALDDGTACPMSHLDRLKPMAVRDAESHLSG